MSKNLLQRTGITRPVDDLGRIVLPKELRTSMGIREGDRLEIMVTGEHIVLAKAVLRDLREHQPFDRGGGDERLPPVRGKAVCADRGQISV